MVYLQALRGWRCPKEPQINPKKQIQTHISDNFKTDSYSTAIRFVLKIRAVRFFWQTALNFLSDGSDNLIGRLRCNVRCCVASVCWVSLASNMRDIPYVCTPWQNSAYPLAERLAVDGFCQGYTCWLHVCYAYRKEVALTLQSRAIAIFHLTLGMMVDGWWMTDNRCDRVGSWVAFICDICDF